MPVLSQLSEVVKIGKTASGGLPAEVSATIDAISQSIIAGPSLIPVPFPPGVIPNIPFGIPISIILTKLEGMMFKNFEDLSAITKQLMAKYNADMTKATKQRELAATTLQNNLTTKQDELKEELVELQTELEEINTSIPELEIKQNEEMAAYQALIFSIKDAALKAETDGRIAEKDALIESISSYDDWLAEIIVITVDIIMLKLRIPSLESDIAEKEFLANISIGSNWEVNVGLADLFEVAVPPYPDLPSTPELPTMPPIPSDSELVKAMRKAFGKWVVTPMIFPFGIPLAAMLLYLQSLGPVPPPLAAKLESMADAAILQGGGTI